MLKFVSDILNSIQFIYLDIVIFFSNFQYLLRMKFEKPFSKTFFFKLDRK